MLKSIIFYLALSYIPNIFSSDSKGASSHNISETIDLDLKHNRTSNEKFEYIKNNNNGTHTAKQGYGFKSINLNNNLIWTNNSNDLNQSCIKVEFDGLGLLSSTKNVTLHLNNGTKKCFTKSNDKWVEKPGQSQTKTIGNGKTTSKHSGSNGTHSPLTSSSNPSPASACQDGSSSSSDRQSGSSSISQSQIQSSSTQHSTATKGQSNESSTKTTTSPSSRTPSGTTVTGRSSATTGESGRNSASSRTGYGGQGTGGRTTTTPKPSEVTGTTPSTQTSGGSAITPGESDDGGTKTADGTTTTLAGGTSEQDESSGTSGSDADKSGGEATNENEGTSGTIGTTGSTDDTSGAPASGGSPTTPTSGEGSSSTSPEANKSASPESNEEAAPTSGGNEATSTSTGGTDTDSKTAGDQDTSTGSDGCSAASPEGTSATPENGTPVSNSEDVGTETSSEGEHLSSPGETNDQQDGGALKSAKSENLNTSDVKVYTIDQSNKIVEINSSDYVKEICYFGFQFIFHQGVKCVQIKYKNEQLWTSGNESSDNYQSPKSLSYYKSSDRFVVSFDKHFFILRKENNEWKSNVYYYRELTPRYPTSNSNIPITIDKSEVVFLTHDDSDNNKSKILDVSKYKINETPNLTVWLFEDDSNCTEFKLLGMTLWKKSHDKYPVSLSYYKTTSRFVVNFGKELIVLRFQNGVWKSSSYNYNTDPTPKASTTLISNQSEAKAEVNESTPISLNSEAASPNHDPTSTAHTPECSSNS